MSEKIAHIELHDACIENVKLFPAEQGEVNFEHIVVYQEIALDRYAVWSYRAEIHMDGIVSLGIKGALLKDDSISDGTFLDKDGNEISLVSLLKTSPVSNAQIVMTSGTFILVELKSATLKLLAPIKRLEEWIGPL